MKRVLIALIALSLTLTVSLYAMHRVESTHRSFSAAADNIDRALAAEDMPQTLAAIRALDSYWQEESDFLGHFTRHSLLDAVSGGIALLYPLAEYGECAWLRAEMESLRRQVEKLREEELFRLTNIF